ncbi:MAG: pirin family protein [Alphaproteobacteria bacterium PRO2]|nr:pirin family protein [Alphaproteobacteria bacterium PRO2]
MTFKIHERDLRGRTKTGWLDSYHTFSFGDFRDPERMGFRSLRVINEDFVIPGAGFPTHPHSDMEIITVILKGELAHKDSMGNGATIRPGEVQKMSAGSGITHSEFNPSNDNPVHLLQIWIRPDTRGIKPGYEQIIVDQKNAKDGWVLVGDREGSGNVVSIHQDAKLFTASLKTGEKISYAFNKDRYGFLQIARGEIDLRGETVRQGDGVEISGEGNIEITAKADSELLLFDLG